ncbi:MAG: hypothetical protein RLY16_2879 [Bacteroidota bacterium]|jgi:hypothetical protein
MKKKIFYAALSLCAISNYVNAQDSTRKVDLSGSVDAYYRHDFANSGTNNFTSFTNSQNSFEVGMATLRVDASALSGKVAATIDVGFGRRAEEFSYNDGDAGTNKNGFISLSNLKQLFITYNVNSKLKFTAGKFATHVGYELLDAPLNRNYSMSYMFTNGPFFHAGLKADYVAGPIGLMLGLTNYTDQTSATNSVKSLIGQVNGSFNGGNSKFYLNYVGSYGSDNLLIPGGLKSLTQYDLVVTQVVNSKLNLALNATLQHRTNGTTKGSWKGAALYVNYDPTAKLGFTLRSEYVSDNDLVYFGTQHLFANTLSLNYKVGPLTIVPELRFDQSKAAIFSKSGGASTTHAASALVAILYKF